MLTKLRKRLPLTPATAIAALALVFAMTGGAYAAGKYVITSTKQISPKVLKSLQGKAGAKGATGATGAAGLAGAPGAGTTGPQGAPGTPGAAGKEGPAGKEGKQGPPGTTGFTQTLPKGSTEKGTWASQSFEGNTRVVVTPISFNIPLSASLSKTQVFFIPAEGANPDPDQCPGSVAAPEASEGNLCVYAGFLTLKPDVETGGIDDPSAAEFGVAGAATTGASLVLEPETPEGGLAYGTWAVTAG
jgi:hypothetical protein